MKYREWRIVFPKMSIFFALICKCGVAVVAQWKSKGYGVAVSCGVGGRLGADLTMLWLWHRLAATAPTGSLAWEPPHAAGMGLKRQKKKK